MSVYDLPEEIYVFGYVWSNGGVSGGRQEVFTTRLDLVRRITFLAESGEVKDRDKAKVWAVPTYDRPPYELKITWPGVVEVGE